MDQDRMTSSSGGTDAPKETSAYDNDGLLAQQTPGLDPDAIRREAGPDWPAGTTGDLQADTSGGTGGGGSTGSGSSGPGSTAGSSTTGSSAGGGSSGSAGS